MDRKNFSYTDAEKAAAGYRAHFDVDIYTFFAAGLKESIRTRTMGSVNPPRNITDLLVAARSVELEMNRHKKLLVDAIGKGNDSKEEAKDLPVEQQVLLLQKEIADLKVTKSKANITCYKCQKKGHFARECRGERQQRGGQGFRRGGHGGRGYRGGQRGFRGGWNRNRGQPQQSWAVEREDGDLIWAPASEN